LSPAAAASPCFPPDQVANLYVGPLDHTMAGQPASMAPLKSPDFDRFPRFREALAAARTAELEPGDAIYIPTLWWHHVEALSAFNVLVNYWWEDPSQFAGGAFEAMIHGIMSVSYLPPNAAAPGGRCSTIMSCAPTASRWRTCRPSIAASSPRRRRS
jgi:hypothetical protein